MKKLLIIGIAGILLIAASLRLNACVLPGKNNAAGINRQEQGRSVFITAHTVHTAGRFASYGFPGGPAAFQSILTAHGCTIILHDNKKTGAHTFYLAQLFPSHYFW